MSILEGQQQAKTRTSFARRPDDKVLPLDRRRSASTMMPDGAVIETKLDAHGRTGLAYVVCKQSGRVARSWKPNPGFAAEDTSDETLLRKVAEGDRAAMHIIFARYQASILRFVHRTIANRTVAEDIVSQVFVDVWRTASRFEHRAQVSTWLYSIARFKTITALRQRVHENVEQDSVRSIADTADTPEAVLDRKETSGRLQACLNKLSAAHREIIDLFYLREKSVTEVSELIGVPVPTVKSRMFYARKRLAKILVDAGLHVPAHGEESKHRIIDDRTSRKAAMGRGNRMAGVRHQHGCLT